METIKKIGTLEIRGICKETGDLSGYVIETRLNGESHHVQEADAPEEMVKWQFENAWIQTINHYQGLFAMFLANTLEPPKWFQPFTETLEIRVPWYLNNQLLNYENAPKFRAGDRVHYDNDADDWEYLREEEAIELNTAVEKHREFDKKRSEHEMQRFFAWRKYYAEKMLEMVA